MPKYEPLTQFLKRHAGNERSMSFAEVEEALGSKLPASAFSHQAWWANGGQSHAQAKAWLQAGYETSQVDVAGRKLVFRRIRPLPEKKSPGFSEPDSMFKHDGNIEKKPFRSPLWGALKGTFTIEPGYDLTSPMYTEEEWAEIEKEMEEDWDQIEQGLSGGKK